MLQSIIAEEALSREALDEAIDKTKKEKVNQENKEALARKYGLDLFGYATYDDELVYLIDVDGDEYGYVEYGYGHYAVPLSELVYAPEPTHE